MKTTMFDGIHKKANTARGHSLEYIYTKFLNVPAYLKTEESEILRDLYTLFRYTDNKRLYFYNQITERESTYPLSVKPLKVNTVEQLFSSIFTENAPPFDLSRQEMIDYIYFALQWVLDEERRNLKILKYREARIVEDRQTDLFK